ncbi:MAG: F0F1 ATP synthase subunit delta [Thermomicrobiales bacterium]
MPANAAARRYAQAVFDIGKERNTLAVWDVDLRIIRETLTADPALMRAFANPETSLAERQRLVERLFASSLMPAAYNFVRLLLRNHRLILAPQVQEAFDEMYLAEQGIAYADVTTAVPLSADEEARVAASLTRFTGKTIKLRTHVDPEIIGGILARVGDQLIDGTVTSQLRQLKNRLAAV